MKLPKTDSTSKARLMSKLRHVALVLSLLVVAYGLMVTAYEWQPGISQLNPGLVFTTLVSLLWLGFSGWIFINSIANRLSRPSTLTSLVLLHIFSVVYLVGIVNFSSPLSFLWALLIIVSYLHFGRLGLVASITVYVAALIVYLIATAPLLDDVILTALSTSLVFFVSGIAVMIIRSYMSNQQLTSQSQAQASLQQDRTMTLVNNLADAVISTDRYGTIILYNAAALSLIDTNANILGQNIDRVIDTLDAEGNKISCWEILHKASTVTTRDDIYIKDGDQNVRLEMTFSPVRGNYSDTDSSETYELGGYVIILRDITKSKSLEEERDEFISVVSHELRTPITIAEGTLSNVSLMMDHGKTPKDRLHDAVKIAHEQVIFLARMVNDLSTLSRAERGVADEPEKIDLDAMIHDIYNEHREEAAAKELSFDLNLSGKAGTVLASRLYLKELLQNFVTNAIKYTESGGVTIKMHSSAGKITVGVTDTGIGISKTDQRRIFNKFYRAEDYRTRETNGTGLGLYVASKLARKIGTEIQVTSRLNHGSTFSIDLPADDKLQANATDS